MRNRQGKTILTKAAAGILRLVDQFAQGDHRARRDLIHIAERLDIDLTAGQRDALQRSAIVALSQNDRELVDEFVQHYLAEREALQQQQNYSAAETTDMKTKE